METPSNLSSIAEPGLLRDIHDTLRSMQDETRHVAAVVASLDEKISLLAEPKGASEVAMGLPQAFRETDSVTSSVDKPLSHDVNLDIPLPSDKIPGADILGHARPQHQSSWGRNTNLGLTGKSRIILTTYPGQSGIHPIPMNWGHADPMLRGPVLVSRDQSTIRRRNGMRFGIACHK